MNASNKFFNLFIAARARTLGSSVGELNRQMEVNQAQAALKNMPVNKALARGINLPASD